MRSPPVFGEHADRHADFLHHHDHAVAYVARIALDEAGPRGAARTYFLAWAAAPSSSSSTASGRSFTRSITRSAPSSPAGIREYPQLTATTGTLARRAVSTSVSESPTITAADERPPARATAPSRWPGSGLRTSNVSAPATTAKRSASPSACRSFIEKRSSLFVHTTRRAPFAASAPSVAATPGKARERSARCSS